jgi:glycosyltransferase involved in cell wall biosynthesis
MIKLVNIVVPCFNEEAVLPQTARQLAGVVDDLVDHGIIAPASCIYFVDDGSRDRTWEIICELWQENPERFHGIKLSRNFGHQGALLAGLRNAPGDALISIDADLQDDTAVIGKMVRHFLDGYDIVYGVRRSRDSDTVLKRSTARAFYCLLQWCGVRVVTDHADFRLMSRRALDTLAQYNEVNLFLRAIVPLLGFRSACVDYDRLPRLAGESKYPLTKMVGLALNGLTSFTMQPLRLITLTGITISIGTFAVGLWALALGLFTDRTVPGWTSTVVPIAFLGGLQLLALGTIGEYIGKIYLEVKRRPLFNVERIL